MNKILFITLMTFSLTGHAGPFRDSKQMLGKLFEKFFAAGKSTKADCENNLEEFDHASLITSVPNKKVPLKEFNLHFALLKTYTQTLQQLKVELENIKHQVFWEVGRAPKTLLFRHVPKEIIEGYSKWSDKVYSLINDNDIIDFLFVRQLGLEEIDFSKEGIKNEIGFPAQVVPEISAYQIDPEIRDRFYQKLSELKKKLDEARDSDSWNLWLGVSQNLEDLNSEFGIIVESAIKQNEFFKKYKDSLQEKKE